MKRTALVTGANRGIGFAIAQKLAELEYRVFLGSRDNEAGQEAAERLRKLNLNIELVQIDLCNSAQLKESIQLIQGNGAEIDVLVNNAGILYESPILELSDAQIDESIAVHLTGPLCLIRELVPGMTSRGYGRIVNVSSNWASFAQGMGGPGVYGITKAALNALTLRLAKELPSLF